MPEDEKRKKKKTESIVLPVPPPPNNYARLASKFTHCVFRLRASLPKCEPSDGFVYNKKRSSLPFLWGGSALWSVKLFEVIKFLSGCTPEQRCSEQHTWENSTFIEKSLRQQFEPINIHGVAEINWSREDKHLPEKSVTGQFCGWDFKLQHASQVSCIHTVHCVRSVRCCTYSTR